MIEEEEEGEGGDVESENYTDHSLSLVQQRVDEEEVGAKESKE